MKVEELIVALKEKYKEVGYSNIPVEVISDTEENRPISNVGLDDSGKKIFIFVS